MTRAWRAHCDEALTTHEEISVLMPPWPVPPALRWWRDAHPPPVAGAVPRQNSYDGPALRSRIDRHTP
jgi:hypothetical protein